MMPVNSETTPETDIAETLSQNTGSQIMRDKLHRVIRNKLPATKQMDDIAPVVTDAVIAALPDMVVPLEWVGLESGPYQIVITDSRLADLYCHAIRDEEDDPAFITGGYLSLVSLDDLKAAAQDHHAAQALSAFGITPPNAREDT